MHGRTNGAWEDQRCRRDTYPRDREGYLPTGCRKGIYTGCREGIYTGCREAGYPPWCREAGYPPWYHPGYGSYTPPGYIHYLHTLGIPGTDRTLGPTSSLAAVPYSKALGSDLRLITDMKRREALLGPKV